MEVITYRLLAYQFQHGDDIQTDLVIRTAEKFGFDPYSVPESFLARSIEAFARKEIQK